MAVVPTGTKLGKYEVVKPLASGGMTELLLARTAPTARPLVLKWIRPEQAIDGSFIETFVREGRRASQLHHPNIVEVHEVGREDGTHYLAMEYVHGDDLHKLLARLHERRAKLPVQHILAVSTAVAQALHHAHEQRDGDGKPVLHLGIKPGNVIITADGAVKLADFGIGSAALAEERMDLLPSIVGYLSPEQCAGQPVDRRSDVFGLGILMYELAVGRRLFKGENEFVTMATILAGDIPPPTKHRGDLPRELEAVILKALARAPEDRFQSAHELQAALDKFATKAGVRGSLTTLSGYTKRLFGVRPEPWLVDDDSAETSSRIEFDGSPKGIAVPPPEAASCNLPSFVTAADDSPIMRVRKKVTREMPTEQLNLNNLKAAPPPDKSAPVKIPSPGNGNGARAAKPTRIPPAPAPAPTRTKPKTVQIPVVVADKVDESTRVMAQPPAQADEQTEVLVDVDLVSKEEVTKQSRQMPAASAVPSDALTPTRPIERAQTPTTPRTLKPGDEDTTPSATSLDKKPNGANGAARAPLVSLAQLREADAKREAARAKLPPPRPPVVETERTDTDTEELAIESTAVANPPPMPPVVATTMARDNTELVTPLPRPGENTVTATDSIVAGPRSKLWLMLGGVAAAAAVAIIAVVVGFGGGGATATAKQNQRGDEPPPQDDPVAQPDEPKPAAELRTSSEPRTPRNSGVTSDNGEPPPDEPTPDEPTPDEAEIAIEPPDEPDPEPPPKSIADEVPPPPKFVEPKDPAPPDEPVAKPAKKPTTTKTVAQKPKPKAKAPKPKPKPRPKAKTKPKPKGKWDPGSLFPK